MLNAQRSRQGQGALGYDPALQAFAQSRAQLMAAPGLKLKPPGFFCIGFVCNGFVCIRALRRRRVKQFLFSSGSVRVLHERSKLASSGGCDGSRQRGCHFLRGLPLVAVAIAPGLIASLGIVLLGMGGAQAQEPVSGTASLSPNQARQSIQWLAGQMMRHVPRTITGDDDWGDTKDVWAGVRIRRDGWKLKTNRRKKELRHGRWIRYQVDLPVLAHPDATGRVVTDSIHVQSVAPVRGDLRVDASEATNVNESTDVNAWRIDASVRTPADFSVRVERWNLGLKLYSVEISGKMTLAMQTRSTLSMSPDWSEIPPAMQLTAKVEQASLAMERFEVERISKIGGDVAEEIGDLAENTIGKVWVRKENQRLASRLNRAIESNRDDLRWSMSDWFNALQASGNE